MDVLHKNSVKCVITNNKILEQVAYFNYSGLDQITKESGDETHFQY